MRGTLVLAAVAAFCLVLAAPAFAQDAGYGPDCEDEVGGGGGGGDEGGDGDVIGEGGEECPSERPPDDSSRGGGGERPLADTGFELTNGALAAGVLLVAGSGLVLAGRRRRGSRT